MAVPSADLLVVLYHWCVMVSGVIAGVPRAESTTVSVAIHQVGGGYVHPNLGLEQRGIRITGSGAQLTCRAQRYLPRLLHVFDVDGHLEPAARILRGVASVAVGGLHHYVVSVRALGRLGGFFELTTIPVLEVGRALEFEHAALADLEVAEVG